MKKIFAALLTAAVIVPLSGCDIPRNRSAESSEAVPEQSADEDTAAEEAVTEAALSAAESLPETAALEPAEGVYVYDNAGVLTDENIAEINSYAETLYESRLINAAVVTTNDIGGKTPYEYADEAYTEIYQGRGSGLLLLINNDTNYDYLYRTGSCLVFIPEGADRQAFFWATRDIVGGDHRSAILRLLQLGERCPQHVFDNAGLFSEEEIAALEEALAACSNDVSVLATSNGTASSNEEICRSYYERRCKDGKGWLMMIDSKTKTMTVVSDSAAPAGLDKAVAAAEKLISAGDEPGAVNEIVKIIG